MTESIKFTKEKNKETLNYSFKPVLNIVRVSCTLSEGLWANRLINAALTVKIFCLDNNGLEVAAHQDFLGFSGFISTYHMQPILEINRFIRFSNEMYPEIYTSSKVWKIEIELKNIDLNNTESISVEIMDSEYILKRIKDWKNRIEDLYYQISEWIKEKQFYSLKITPDLEMFEEMMEKFEIKKEIMNSADIYFNKKLQLTFKPYGLFIIGANGRIDIISKAGNFLLIDNSQQFEKPDWRIYLSNKKENYPFDNNLFLRLIEK